MLVKEYEQVGLDIDEGGSLTSSDEIGYYVACEIDNRRHRRGYFYVLVLDEASFQTLPQAIRDEVD